MTREMIALPPRQQCGQNLATPRPFHVEPRWLRFHVERLE